MEKIKQLKMDTTKFDIADYLDSKEMIAEYLNTVLEEGDNADVINAIGHIAKAIGMTKIAEQTKFIQSSIRRSKTTICDHNESIKSHWWTNTSESNFSIKNNDTTTTGITNPPAGRAGSF